MPKSEVAIHIGGMDERFATRNLRGLLTKRRADLAAQIAEGYAKDWADYRERVGELKGIDGALAICTQVEDNQ